MLDTDDKKEIKKPCRSHAVFCSIFLKGGSSPVHILFFSRTRRRTTHQYIKKKKGDRSPECYRYKGSVTQTKYKITTLIRTRSVTHTFYPHTFNLIINKSEFF